MATGYLAGTGQNPYIAQNLNALFHNTAFQGLTTIGYPPPLALVLGFVYLFSYRIYPNLLLYNVALKLPIIAANIGLAFLVAHILNRMGFPRSISRRAWVFMLFNPFLLLTTSAWGQFDSIVALFSLLSLLLMVEGRLIISAVLFALAVSLKPTAFPLILVILVFLAGKSLQRTMHYFAVFILCMILFCVVPFALFGWDPSPILEHWNFQFTQGGGMSFMTFLEYTKWSYRLPGQWWFLGWLWIPALGLATFALRPGIKGLRDVLTKSVGVILVFFLSRAWLAETNVNLVLPFILILASANRLGRISLAAVWILPLTFSFFNSDLAQLFFPSMPGFMDMLLKWFVVFSTARYSIRTAIVVFWLLAGWWIVHQCFRNNPTSLERITA